MKSKTIYIISGCNGAGKTTASFTILPEILNCKEFVNADEIARGLSPFQPDEVAFEAGRIMLERFNYLVKTEQTFAIETTLATKIYKGKIEIAIELGYSVRLLFFWLPTVQMAIDRVAIRVSEGGHNIPDDIVTRRYFRGMQNLLKIYIPLCNEWAVFDNSDGQPLLLARGLKKEITVMNKKIWNNFKSEIL